ncbi:molybdopterin-dependent oxidoreductase, partial [Arenimonas sp. GDDSR-1]|uniref:molybdopterin-dependent oxidoreductase n=1 Tax=Arenimonas sp. GDDSR-1 TaxID=2950125 RepID=UPI0026364C1C
DFTFDVASKVIVPPSGLADALSALSVSLADGSVLILGEIAENHAEASHIRAAAKALQQAGKASVCRLPQGANALGLAQHNVLPGEGGRHAGAMLDGDLKALLLFGIEPQFDFSDTTRAVKAMIGAKVVACSAYVTESLKELADVILPIGLLPEIQATLTNADGRDQHAEAAGKLPGSAQSGWRVLRALYEAAALPALDFTDIDGLHSGLVKHSVTSGTGLSAKRARSEGFERISTSPIYRGDAVTRRAASLQAHPLNAGPRLVMHPAAAAKIGLQEGQIAKVGDGTGSAALPVVLSRMVPESCVWIETNHPATAPLSQTASLAIVRAAP